MPKAMLFDSSSCIACRGCQVACNQWWELSAITTSNRGSYENPPELGPETWNKIRFREVEDGNSLKWLFTRQACMHCTDAACVWVCPSYARTYDANGHVAIDRERCIGCGRCVQYCPFEAPNLGPDDVTSRINVESYTPRKVAYKCTWCQDRLDSGMTTACVKTCPTESLVFGEQADIIEEGNKRLSAIKANFPDANLYGVTELGGLHVLYLLTEAPYVHGLPENPQLGEYPAFDSESFPDWYIDALKQGIFAAFPTNAKREWYMEPDLQPTSKLRGAVLDKSKDFFEKNRVASWSWLGVGAGAASAAFIWLHKRRQDVNGDNGKKELLSQAVQPAAKGKKSKDSPE
ncbi:4Fe-4S dicluster domain-containing protein [Chloroflexota bacterium]